MPLINRRGRVQIEIPDKLMQRGERMRLFSQVLLSTVRSSAKILSLVLCTPPVISSVERLRGNRVMMQMSFVRSFLEGTCGIHNNFY